MFEFPETVSSIDAVPPDFQGLYAQSGESYVISDTVKAAAVAMRKISGSLEKSRKEADDYKKKVVDLSPLADYGQTPEEIANKFSERLAESSKNKIDIDKMKQEIAQAQAQKFSTETKALQTRNEALTKQLYMLNVRNGATDALTAEKGNLELLMPHVERQVSQVEEDGKLKAYVVDAEGTRRFSPTTGEPMTIRELVSEMKGNPIYAPAFESQKKSGGGTQPDRSSRNGVSTNTGELSPTQKITAGLEARRK